MIHARQAIREAVAAILAPLAVPIHTTRITPVITLPCISLSTLSESAAPELVDHVGATIRYRREVDLVIDVLVEDVAGVDDLVDDYAAQIEALLAADPTLTGTATDAALVRTTADGNGDGERSYMQATLTYLVRYRTQATDAETAI